MTIFDFLFKNSNKNTRKNKFSSTPLEFHHNNIVYPKNSQENEIDKLYDEIKGEDAVNNNKSAENLISASYPKYEIKKNNLDCKYSDNILKKNRYLNKQFATFVSEKEKYKILKEKVDVLLQKGDDIFVKNEW